MEAKDDKKEALPAPGRSSWSAAIAQLPGYPAKPVPPQAPGPVREVSMGSEHEDDQQP
ncbi:MAG TPA: hypothetical protein VM140_08580 [Burkholderiales bacterium]|nr:hypothetical protein [Burkholderiales bacterium]